VKRTEIVPADVERPVVVQQACAAALGQLAAETEILAEALQLGRFGHDCRASILPIGRRLGVVPPPDYADRPTLRA